MFPHVPCKSLVSQNKYMVNYKTMVKNTPLSGLPFLLFSLSSFLVFTLPLLPCKTALLCQDLCGLFGCCGPWNCFATSICKKWQKKEHMNTFVMKGMSRTSILLHPSIAVTGPGCTGRGTSKLYKHFTNAVSHLRHLPCAMLTHRQCAPGPFIAV